MRYSLLDGMFSDSSNQSSDWINPTPPKKRVTHACTNIHRRGLQRQIWWRHWAVGSGPFLIIPLKLAKTNRKKNKAFFFLLTKTKLVQATTRPHNCSPRKEKNKTKHMTLISLRRGTLKCCFPSWYSGSGLVWRTLRKDQNSDHTTWIRLHDANTKNNRYKYCLDWASFRPTYFLVFIFLEPTEDTV